MSITSNRDLSREGHTSMATSTPLPPLLCIRSKATLLLESFLVT